MKHCVIRILIVHLVLLLAAPVVAAGNAAVLMRMVYEKMESGGFSLGDCVGELYVKQSIEIEKRNIALDFIPTLTHFDKNEKRFLSEFFYDIHIMEHSLPAIKRKAVLTTHKRGSGEMDIVSGFITPALFNKKILCQGFLSPLHRSNSAYYEFSIDTLQRNDGCEKVDFVQRFDNVKLLKCGWLLLDEDSNICAFYIEGNDEQCSFCVEYRMSGEYKQLLHNVSLDLKYDFAGNKLNVNAYAQYDYTSVQQLPPLHKRKDAYNLSPAVDTTFIVQKVNDVPVFVAQNRPLQLAPSDSLLYAQKGMLDAKKDSVENNDDILWAIGDGMISAHSYDWGDGNIKMSPIINPSFLSYSSSRGLSYKMRLNFKNTLSEGRLFSFTPTGGYNFKQETFYWDVDTRFLFDPMHLGSVSIDVGSGNRTYSSAILDRIENIAVDSLVFENLDIRYFRHFYVSATVRRELCNGLELLLGTHFHRRSIVGSLPDRTSGGQLQEVYRQLAPYMCIVWQPGMYYYIKDGRKINIGSRNPRFSLDVEQGISRVFGSDGAYTRAEIDVQHSLPMRGDARLYLRAGGGGFFHTDDLYFADYAFLRENNLPVERSDELGGVFQLLGSEWYNAANKYFRAHATYESPFFVIQRLLPKSRIIENERLYVNMLFMSHLMPYTELGYGVDTPYVDVGFFVSAKDARIFSLGYKITVSLFRD